MPIYEYQCQSCGHSFDAIQKFSDAPLKQCPECQQDALSKLISAPSFHLKGSGWYETDFKNKNKPGEGKAAAGGEAKSDTSANSAVKASDSDKAKTKDKDT